MSKLHLGYLTNTLGTSLSKIKGHRILISYIRIAIKNYNLIQSRGGKISSQIFGIILTYLMNNLQDIQMGGVKNGVWFIYVDSRQIYL